MESREPIGDRIASGIGRLVGAWLVKRRCPELLPYLQRPAAPAQRPAEPTAPATQPTASAPPTATSPPAAEIAAPAPAATPSRPAAHEMVDLLLMLSADFLQTFRPALTLLATDPDEVAEANQVLAEAHATASKGLELTLDRYELLMAGSSAERRDAETLAPLVQLMRQTYITLLRLRQPGQVRGVELPSMDEFAAVTCEPQLQTLMAAALRSASSHPTVN